MFEKPKILMLENFSTGEFKNLVKKIANFEDEYREWKLIF